MIKSKILVVEDDSTLLETLEDVLNLHGYEVYTSTNGLSGFNNAQRILPDLILSDVMMPGMSGLDMAEKIRNEDKTSSIPFLFLSGNNSESDRIKGLTLGAIDYISKPFSMDELLLKVRNVIESRKELVKKIFTTNTLPISQTRDVSFMKNLQVVLSKQLNNSNLQLDQLAELMHMSPSSLQKNIKKNTNKSVSRFVREYRLKQAHQLIKNTNFSLSEIAFQTGFNSLSYFTRSYKGYYGQSPMQSKK
mgnify:CR=1 FL=1